jgi:hypothetical protein
MVLVFEYRGRSAIASAYKSTVIIFEIYCPKIRSFSLPSKLENSYLIATKSSSKTSFWKSLA